jgi:hypothetical protein
MRIAILTPRDCQDQSSHLLTGRTGKIPVVGFMCEIEEAQGWYDVYVDFVATADSGLDPIDDEDRRKIYWTHGSFTEVAQLAIIRAQAGFPALTREETHERSPEHVIRDYLWTCDPEVLRHAKETGNNRGEITYFEMELWIQPEPYSIIISDPPFGTN